MSIPTTLTFLAYLIAMLGIGVYAYQRTHNLTDYILGGRRLGPAVTALSAGASDMSGWLLLGLPGAIYVSGLVESWIVIGLVAGALLNWLFVAQPLRRLTAGLGAITLPDYLELRFQHERKVLRVVSAFVVLLFFTFYTASGLVAGAKLFTSTFEMSYNFALFAGAVVIIAYTAIGGFLAVSWTDLVQGLLMMAALVIVPLVIVTEMGGVGAIVSQLDASQLNMSEGVTLMAVVSLLAWGLGYFGQPHILARFMAIENPAYVPQATLIGMAWMVISTVAAVLVGLFGIVYLADQPLADGERIFIQLTQVVFNPWIAGILLAAILAAVMSTIDSQLLVSSSALSEDFYKTWFRPDATDQELVKVGRITVLLIACVALFIASDPDSRVLGLVSYAWAGLGASFGPVVLLSLYWQRMTGWGALAGLVTGAVTVVVWKQLSGGLFDLYELLPGFVFGVVAIIGVSLLDSEPEAGHLERIQQLKGGQ